MRIRLILYIPILFLFLCASLHSATFTCSSPAEIQEALDNVSAGDTILIDPGTCTYILWGNTRYPGGNMYQTYTGSSYTEVDPGITETPVPTVHPAATLVPTQYR